jgi:hypothetical protein
MKRKRAGWTLASIARQGITSEWGLQIYEFKWQIDGKKKYMKECKIINLKSAIMIRGEL